MDNHVIKYFKYFNQLTALIITYLDVFSLQHEFNDVCD